MGRVPIRIMRLEHSTLNRTQRLVMSFFAFAWAALVVILFAAPGIYEQSLRLPGGKHEVPPLYFLGAISAFIALLGVGVTRRWRWTFWLVLVAFILGVVRLPASALQLIGVVPAQGPAWAWYSSPSGWRCWPAIGGRECGEAHEMLWDPESLSRGRNRRTPENTPCRQFGE